MQTKRLFKFAIMMLTLMASSQYFIVGRGSILMMPAVLVVYVIMTFILKTKGDYTLNIMIAYSMSHFHLATKAGMLGPWLILAYLMMNGRIFIDGKYFKYNSLLIIQIIIFLVLNLLGLIVKNPNTLFENMTSFISLIGLLVTLVVVSNYEFNKNDIKFVILIFIIMTAYTLLSAINTSLGLIYTTSPLFSLNEVYFGSHWGVPMFGRSCSEYFLCMNIFFAYLLTTQIDVLFGIKRHIILLAYIISFVGCIIGFSKTMTTILIISNAVILVRNIISIDIKKTINIITGLGVLVIILIMIRNFLNIDYIFERFNEQPEIFKRVYENPLTAEGTSRDYSFYWGWRRNLDYSWFLGYGWSPADANNAAYFHNLPINISKHDFHNLYLSIFPVFGWIGGGIFLWWLLSLLIKSLRMSRMKNLYIKTIGSAFFGLSIVFLLGEYAIPITSEANYMFILFVWMGMVNSLYNTSKQVKLNYHY